MYYNFHARHDTASSKQRTKLAVSFNVFAYINNLEYSFMDLLSG